MGTVPQAYFNFVMDYAPYFYYIPGTGVDPEWGRGPAPAAHAIDFLYEAYFSPLSGIKSIEIELTQCLTFFFVKPSPTKT